MTTSAPTVAAANTTTVGSSPLLRPNLSVLGTSIDDLTSQELAALRQMREEFDHLDYAEKNIPDATFALNDYTYLKYLRARDLDVAKAKQILHKTLGWRNEKVPAAITRSRPGLIMEAEIMGKGKEGHPIIYLEMTDFDPRKYTMEDYLASRVFELEETFRVMAKDGWKVDRYILLCDMKDFRFFKHCTPHALRMYSAFSEVMQSLYRDSIHVCIVANPLMGAQTLFTIMKPWIKPASAKRLVFAKDVQNILEHIDVSNLYQHLGGTKVRLDAAQ